MVKRFKLPSIYILLKYINYENLADIMENQEIRKTFTGNSERPTYGLPKQRSGTVGGPRGSVKAIVEMYENRARNSSLESEKVVERESSVGKLSEDKLKPFIREKKDGSDVNLTRKTVGMQSSKDFLEFVDRTTLTSRIPDPNDEEEVDDFALYLQKVDVEKDSITRQKLGIHQQKKLAEKVLKNKDYQTENIFDTQNQETLINNQTKNNFLNLDKKNFINEDDKSFQPEFEPIMIDYKEKDRVKHNFKTKPNVEVKLAEKIQLKKDTSLKEDKSFKEDKSLKKDKNFEDDKKYFPLDSNNTLTLENPSELILEQSKLNKLDQKYEQEELSKTKKPKSFTLAISEDKNPIKENFTENTSKPIKKDELKEEVFQSDKELFLKYENNTNLVEKKLLSSKKIKPEFSEEKKNENFWLEKPDPEKKIDLKKISEKKVETTEISKKKFETTEISEKKVETPEISKKKVEITEISKKKLETTEFSGEKIKLPLQKVPTQQNFSITEPEQKLQQQSRITQRYPPITNKGLLLDLTSLSIQEKTGQAEDLINEIDILCVNCYECVSIEEVDLHSKTCTKPVLNNLNISDTDIKIRKMLKAITNRKIQSDGVKYDLYCRIEENSIAIIEKSMVILIQNSYKIQENLENLINKAMVIPNGLPLVIFSRRLSNLLEAKGDFYIENSDRDLLKLYEEEAERQKKELERWKLRSELLLQLAGNPASQGVDVNSDVGSSRNSVISHTTVFSDVSSDVGVIEDVEQVLQAISEEELEKHFYRIFVKAKLSLPKNHKGHSINIADVYSQVLEKNIPVSQWKDFISRIF